MPKRHRDHPQEQANLQNCTALHSDYIEWWVLSYQTHSFSKKVETLTLDQKCQNYSRGDKS